MGDFITWENRYSVGIQAIDEQHKRLLELTNTLHEVCLDYGQGHKITKEKFRKTIQATVNYINVHFSAEEKLLDDSKYPDIVAHKSEHKKFVKKVLENVKQFEEGRDFVPSSFVKFLRDWILEHIAMVDCSYGLYLMHLKKEGKLDENILKFIENG